MCDMHTIDNPRFYIDDTANPINHFIMMGINIILGSTPTLSTTELKNEVDKAKKIYHKTSHIWDYCALGVIEGIIHNDMKSIKCELIQYFAISPDTITRYCDGWDYMRILENIIDM